MNVYVPKYKVGDIIQRDKHDSGYIYRFLVNQIYRKKDIPYYKLAILDPGGIGFFRNTPCKDWDEFQHYSKIVDVAKIWRETLQEL